MTKYRKAIAAFLAPLIALPLAGWASGEVEFSTSVLGAAVVAAITAALTYAIPNAPGA